MSEAFENFKKYVNSPEEQIEFLIKKKDELELENKLLKGELKRLRISALKLLEKHLADS